ncbi:MAG TPA: septum formation initiator family protein [Thermodesulfobacteriota bacterium]
MSGKRRFSIRVVLAGLVLAGMGVATVFGDRGLLRMLALERDLAAVQAATDRLAEENRRLAAAIARLRDDPRALEAAARRDLGLVAPDEIVFEFPE